MGHDAVMVKLADDIYLSGKADWTTRNGEITLQKRGRPDTTQSYRCQST